MKFVHLTRFAYSPLGTFGDLVIEGSAFLAYTVERPWVDLNQDKFSDPNVSCIPEGTYGLTLVQDEQTKVTTNGLAAYVVTNVPRRSGIMIHMGNTMKDVKGCICPGLALGFPKGMWGVTDSSVAYKKFMEAMAGEKEGRLYVNFTRNRPA